MAPLNGINHKAHTAIGDCGATLEIAKIIKKKAPSVWNSSLLTSNKEESLMREYKWDEQFYNEIVKDSNFSYGKFNETNYPLHLQQS